MQSNKFTRTELRFQQDCYQLYCRKYPKEIGRLFMIFNNPANSIEGAKLIGAGMLSGLPDFGYLIPGGIVFLELKHGSVQMETQEWFESVCNVFRIDYRIVSDEAEFLKIIEFYRGPYCIELPEMPLSKHQKAKLAAAMKKSGKVASGGKMTWHEPHKNPEYVKKFFKAIEPKDDFYYEHLPDKGDPNSGVSFTDEIPEF